MSRTVVVGNDGIHEWGYTVFDDGTHVNWMENLAARKQVEESILKAMFTDWFSSWRVE